MRFSKGKVCPYCNCEEILKNCKYNNKQRYICKKYGRTFSWEKESIRIKNFIVHSNISRKYTKVKEVKNIQPIFM